MRTCERARALSFASSRGGPLPALATRWRERIQARAAAHARGGRRTRARARTQAATLLFQGGAASGQELSRHIRIALKAGRSQTMLKLF